MEIEIKGIPYQTGKLNPFQQLHVSRRLAPILMSMGAAASVLLKTEDKGKFMEAVVSCLGPLAEAFASMPEEDVNYVLTLCLSVCTRAEGPGWQKVMPSPGHFQYADIDLAVMVQLVFAVVKDNLGNFTLGQPQQ